MAITSDAPVVRRSGNYPPTLWPYDYLQSLRGYNVEEEYETTLHPLIERVRTMISKDTSVENPVSILELVDDLQRLGISRHFKDEISGVLKMIYNHCFETREKWNKLNLNCKALGFRLLREHGYTIPQEIFEDIKDENGNMKAHIVKDTVGVLNLYEASFFGLEDENILDEAREFTTKCLTENLDKKSFVNQSMSMLVSHALELPLLWRIPRFETVWFIDAYERRSDTKPLLLQLAKLDFNIVQRIHQEDLKYCSKWWEGVDWVKKLGFSRDCLVECFTWAVGANHEPQFGVLRRNLAKATTITILTDDLYDLYGTVDELEQFTNIVRSWDVNRMEELPHYMKICFLGIYNTINEMAYNTLTSKELLLIPYLKKAWADYCDSCLLEAQWFANGYTPTLEEYLNLSCITVAIPVMLAHVYLTTSCDISEEALQNIIHCCSMIVRLADDLGTSSAELARGEAPSSIQCYMHENGASEEEARAYIKNLITETWKKLNKESALHHSSSSQIFIECATNFGRMGQFTYRRGDIFNLPDDLHKSHHASLLFNPKF